MSDKTKDIILVAGLAGFLLWTYAVLPLAYFHS
jgi:hypothetical protein